MARLSSSLSKLKHRWRAAKMSDSELGKEGEVKSDTTLFKSLLNQGLALGEEELAKQKLKLQRSIGLGHKPNVVPPGDPDFDCGHRTVEIGWHPVAGAAGKWFAEETVIGKLITDKINSYPDPTQHWAVLVGDYCHELWMDEHLDVIYINEKFNRDEWCTFPVGKTTFNDEALRQAGEMTIFNMRAKQAAYNLISNNCQTFALQLLDAVHIGAHKKFATSFAVYQRALGPGAILDLFPAKEGKEEPEEATEDPAQAVENAQKVMDDNTKRLENPKASS